MINKKAIAGMEIFLSVIAMVFLIGIIVMAFALAGAQMKSSVETGFPTATDTINIIGNTTAAIADAPDWFPTFIVIAAVVVLVLLIVLIVVNLRGSGLLGGNMGG